MEQRIVHTQIVESGCGTAARQVYYAALASSEGRDEDELVALAKAKYAIDTYYAERVVELQGQ